MNRQRTPEIPQCPPEARTYSSSEVAALTGASLRQLQWWDEKELVSPRHNGHTRIYSETEMRDVLIAAGLRKKGVSTQAIRFVFRDLERKACGIRPGESTAPGGFIIVSLPNTGKPRASFETDPLSVIQMAVDQDSAVAVLHVAGPKNDNGGSPKVPAGSKPKRKSK